MSYCISFCTAVLKVMILSSWISKFNIFFWPLVCVTDIFEINTQSKKCSITISNSIWILCNVWIPGSLTTGLWLLGIFALASGGQSIWLGSESIVCGGEGLFSFNISSEPISKSMFRLNPIIIYKLSPLAPQWRPQYTFNMCSKT